jgi:cellulose synthase/poly-beta-1,6-N-acetylglucosamine synthase-like glycosyltransferase
MRAYSVSSLDSSASANRSLIAGCLTWTPDVSVVIPARNEAGYLRGALTSVAAQRCPTGLVEAVVVDNGSVDGTGALARAFGDGG